MGDDARKHSNANHPPTPPCSRRTFLVGTTTISALYLSGCGSDDAEGAQRPDGGTGGSGTGGSGGTGANGGTGATGGTGQDGGDASVQGVRVVSVQPTATGAHVAWATDMGGGTYHVLIGFQETARAGAVVRSADLTGEVTAEGDQSFDISFLAPSRSYQLHLVQQDAAGNVSEVVSAGFTTLDAGQSGTVYRSSDLGWTDGENVSDALAALLVDTLQPGDELVLEHTYLLEGRHELPDDFTLSATPGAGFESVDPMASSSLLIVGRRGTLRNLTISHPLAPDTGTTAISPVSGVDYATIHAVKIEGDDVLVEHCRFHGNVSEHLNVPGVRRLILRGCHVVGGFWAVAWGGGCYDALVEECMFERSLGDGIKTVAGVGDGCQRPLIRNCVFQDNNRDAIDTTGGFQDALVQDVHFRRMQVSGFDLKKIIDSAEDLNENLTIDNVRLQRCDFSDCRTAVVCSTIDNAVLLTASSAPEWAPHDIFVDDCIVERNEDAGRDVRAFLFKDAHTLVYANLRLLGTIELFKATNAYETFGLGSQEASDALNYGCEGTLGEEGEPRGQFSDAPFAFGPA